MFTKFIESLREGVLENNEEKILSLIEEMHPVDIAIALEDMDDESLLIFLDLIDNELKAEILEHSEEELQIKIISSIDYKSTVELFSYMSNDDIADILGVLPINMRKDLLKLMKSGDIKQIQELLGYAEDSAGGIMTTEYIALSGELSILDSLKKIKKIGPKTEVIETIFVLNRNRELVGTADLRDILVAPETDKLYDIMNENLIYVHPDVDQEEVSLLVSKYDLKAIPVINRKKSLLGIITVDDIIDVIVEEHTEDILSLSGVNKDEKLYGSIVSSVKMRLPWLAVNMVTAFIASFTVSLFEDVIAQVVALAAAMPIVTGMGGNSGSQTLAIVIRGIALGDLNLKDDWKLVFKEIGLGVVNGIFIGSVTGLILFMRYGNPYLGFIIFIAMIGNLVIAGGFGFLIPLILKSLGVDPALASSIFLTTATDVFGFFIFLSLAQEFLTLLL